MNKEKETIQLETFLNEVCDAYDIDKSPMEPIERTIYQCENCTCGIGYQKSDKFCTTKGEKILPKKVFWKNPEFDDFVRSVLYELSNTSKEEEKGPYRFMEIVDKKGDGSGWYSNFIFQREKDGKFFFYSSYDGRIEENELEETERVVVETWDFEKYYD